MSIFNKIILCETKFKKTQKIIDCYNKNNDTVLIEYKKCMDELKIPLEFVGELNRQTKPYFDIDYEINKDEIFNEIEHIQKWKEEINVIFPNKDIFILRRNPRLKLNIIKHSYHFIVNNCRISAKTLFNEIKKKNNKIFDQSVYGKDWGLYGIFSNKKVLRTDLLDKDYEIIDPFLPIFDNGEIIKKSNKIFNITDYCVTFIKSDYENFDIIYTNTESIVKPIIYKKLPDVVTEEIFLEDVSDIIKELKTNLDLISIKRLDEYETWYKLMICIINISKKNEFRKDITINIIHEMSKKSNKYNEKKVDMWLDANYENLDHNKGYSWKYLLNTCIKEDNLDYYEKFINKTYKNVKREFDKTIFKCYDPICFIEVNLDQDEINQKSVYIHSKEDLLNKYTELKYYEKDDKKKGVWKQFIPEWLKDEKKKIYHTLTFKPYKLSESLSKKHFNLFKGYRAEKLSIHKDYVLIEPILWHIKHIMCKNNNDHYIWLMQYFAQIIKNPRYKTGVVLVFKSDQGSGKNVIIDMIANGIIGTECSCSTSNPEQVFFGNFNSLLANKTLAICNEAGNKLRDCVDRIKDTATSPDIHIEKKGKDAIKFDNYINIIATTNNKYPLQIAVDDRRICWLEMSNEKKNNTEYFDILFNACSSDIGVSSLYHYFMEEVDIIITNFQNTRPITQEYKKIQKMNISNPIKFFLDEKYTFTFKKSCKIDDHVYIVKKTLFYKRYTDFCDKCKIKSFNKEAFYYEIKNEISNIDDCIFAGNKCIKIFKKSMDKWLLPFINLEKQSEIVIDEDYFEEDGEVINGDHNIIIEDDEILSQNSTEN